VVTEHADAPGRGIRMPETRRERGREARQTAPRRSLPAWGSFERTHDALETVLAQNGIRDGEIVGLRHTRMAASPWNFFRGGAAIMAADLASRPSSGIEVQLAGDAHVLNFGLWATPERNLAFDVRDFDETLPGPFEWDLLRLTASLRIAAQVDRLSKERAEAAVEAAIEAYCTRMREYARMPELDIWYDGMHIAHLEEFFQPADRGRLRIRVEKGRSSRTSRGAFAKLTDFHEGRPRIIPNPPIRSALDDAAQTAIATELFASYRESLGEERQVMFDRFQQDDVVRQIVGVGSVGMRVHLALFEGRNGADPLFLQAKQATASVYEPHLGPSRHAHHGQRVIVGKRLIQSATDVFAGWAHFQGHDYYVRQFRDMKIVPRISFLAPRLVEFATACGATLARAHARTGDPVEIDGYLGSGRAFARGVAEFARAYAAQNERDHAQLAAAVAAGGVPVLAEPE